MDPQFPYRNVHDREVPLEVTTKVMYSHTMLCETMTCIALIGWRMRSGGSPCCDSRNFARVEAVDHKWYFYSSDEYVYVLSCHPQLHMYWSHMYPHKLAGGITNLLFNVTSPTNQSILLRLYGQGTDMFVNRYYQSFHIFLTVHLPWILCTHSSIQRTGELDLCSFKRIRRFPAVSWPFRQRTIGVLPQIPLPGAFRDDARAPLLRYRQSRCTLPHGRHRRNRPKSCAFRPFGTVFRARWRCYDVIYV